METGGQSDDCPFRYYEVGGDGMQEENIIELQFDKATTRLAGNPYGKNVYEEQVKDKIDYNKRNVIWFPANVEKVASSFVQGFFSEIIEKIGYEGVENTVEIESVNTKMKEDMYKDLFI